MSNATNLNSMSAGMGVDSDGRKRNHLIVDGIAEDRLRSGKHQLSDTRGSKWARKDYAQQEAAESVTKQLFPQRT